MFGSPSEINESVIRNHTFINEIWLVADPSEIIIKTAMFVPVVLWGIFWNTVLIYVITRHRHLRSPTNLLIGNMAVADLLSLSVNPWIFLLYNFVQNYPLGEIGCKFEGAFECLLLLASVTSLSAISYDRLTALVLPQETRLTRHSAKVVIATTWFAGAAVASPLYFCRAYKERQWLDFVEKYCTEDTFVINVYWNVIITMMVLLPLVVMSVCYIAIFIKLDRYERDVKKNAKLAIRVRYKAKVARTMFVVVVTFIVCRIPFSALIFYRNQLLKAHVMGNSHEVRNTVNGTYQVLWFASRYLILVNAALNPLIYGLTNEKFRRVMRTTSPIKWMFEGGRVDTPKVTEEKKKVTRETGVESNRHKIFTIFGTRSPFANKQAKTGGNEVAN